MSGLAGIVRFDGATPEADRLEAMRRQVEHRGPAGGAVTVHGGCGLVHARLPIIDLLAGDQPMHLAGSGPAEPRHDHDSSGDTARGHGPLHCVFNGEVYNHRELRRKLEKRGHRFVSDHSDTEVLLLGYRQWGSRLPKHLHGMFAFAIWDEADRTLMLVRDRLGEKPLFLRADAHELIFGSLAATVAAGLPRGQRPTLCAASLLTYLRLGFPGHASMIEGIEELPPASVMTVSATGRLRVETYWRPPPVSRHSTSLGAVEALDEVLGEAVAARLESDVKLGAMLSGGLDSSLVAAVAVQRAKAAGGDVPRTLSVDLPQIGFHASAAAAAVARSLDTEHITLTAESVSTEQAIEDLTRLMAHAGEPLADPSVLPAYWAYRAASSEAGALLSGVGGEEVFGGRPRYRQLARVMRHGWWLSRMPSLFQRAEPDSRGWGVRRCIEAARAGSLASQRYHHLMHVFTDRQIAALAPGVFPTLGEFGAHPAEDWPPIADPMHAAMRWDLAHALPHQVLRRVDRASMAVPLEVRPPLLDTAVIDLAAHLPPRVLMPGGRPKGLLKAVAANHLPLHAADGRAPTFRLPVARWFREHARDALRDYLTDGRLTDLGLRHAEIERYFDEHQRGSAAHTHRLQALLGLSLFLLWLEGLAG